MGKLRTLFVFKRVSRTFLALLWATGLALLSSCTKGTPNVQSLGKSLDPISLYNVVGSTLYITSVQPAAPIRGSVNDKRIQSVVIMVEDQSGLLQEYEKIPMSSSKVSGDNFATSILREKFPKPNGFQIAVKGVLENGETQIASYMVIEDDQRFGTNIAPVAEIFNRTLDGILIPTRNLNFVVKATNEVPAKLRYTIVNKANQDCPSDFNEYTNLIENAQSEFALDISRLADGTNTRNGFDGVVRVCIMGGSEEGYFPSSAAVQVLDIPVDTLAPLLDSSSYLEALTNITTGLTKSLDIHLFFRSGEVNNAGKLKSAYKIGFYYSEGECAIGNVWQDYQDDPVTLKLLNSNVENKVYLKLQDPSGNISICRQVSILHDGLAPQISSAVMSGTNVNSGTEEQTILTKEVSKSWTLQVSEDLLEAKLSWESSDLGLTSGVPCSGTAEDLQNLQVGRYDSSPATLNASNSNFACFAITDKAGNQLIKRYKVIVDNTGPTVSISNSNTGLAKYLNQESLQSFFVTGSCEYGGTKVFITVSGSNQDFGPVSGDCSNTQTYSIEVKDLLALVADGSVTFKAVQQDILGNNSNQATKIFTKDTTAPTPGSPVIDWALGAENITNQSVISGSIQASNLGINAKMKLSNSADCSDGTWVTFASSMDFNIDALERVYNYYMQFKDEASNISSCAAAPPLTKDGVAPLVSITSPAVDAYVVNAANSSFTLAGACTAGDGEVIILKAASGSELTRVPCSGGGTYSATISGGTFSNNSSFELKSMQYDLAGNLGFAKRFFKKDTTMPNMNITSHIEDDWVTNSFTVTGSCDEEGATIGLASRQDSSEILASGSCSGGSYSIVMNVTNLNDGAFSLVASIRDLAMNTAADISIGLRKDSTPPSVVGLNILFNDRRLNDTRMVATLRTNSTPFFKLSGAANDVGSGFARYEMSLGSSDAIRNDLVAAMATASIGPHQMSINLSVGSQYFIQFRAYDNVGNYSIVNADPFEVVSCPANYLKVNPELGFTREPFCVAKFEMRDVGGVATSTASGVPLTNLNKAYAGSECSDLDLSSPTRNAGSGYVPENDSRYSLIANDHWMSVARKIENNPANWMNYGMAGAHIFIGQVRTDFAAGFSVASISNPLDPYSDIPSQSVLTPLGYDRNSLKRTLELEEGQQIWDFNGNAGELMRTTSQVSAAEAISSPLMWRKLDRVVYATTVGKFGPKFFEWVNPTVTDPLDYGLGSVQLSETHYTIYRGIGYRANTSSNYGIYTLRSEASSSYSFMYVGYRCVFEPLKTIEHGY